MMHPITSCPMCKLVLDVERLREEAKAERHASDQRCWIKERTQITDETVITIVGAIDKDQWARLLALCIEIENSGKP